MKARYGLKDSKDVYIEPLHHTSQTKPSDIEKAIERFDILYSEKTELNKKIREYYEPFLHIAIEKKDKAEFDRVFRELPMNLPFVNVVYRMMMKYGLDD